ncbi:LacI family DNA-binding transcriptional regulator [Amphibiibacter pelophylacis]|uniref:LacI family DNA-binding transcriptional regulator n=1 Tax=Amphibiibacter pelophylacis TaxID=1799477 RepID=A0ACC6NYA4_9BURK
MPRSTRQARHAAAAAHRPVRLQDIADSLGVSMITVSRALSQPHKVSPALRERIVAAADRMGYVPNHSAQALASARSRTVLVQVPSLSNIVFIDLLESVGRVLQTAGYHMLICNTHYRGAGDWERVRNYLKHKPDGLLLTGSHLAEQAATLASSLALPVVFMMAGLDDPVTQAPELAEFVGFSQVQAGRAMTEHLLAQGHRRIAFVGAQLDVRVLQRHQGYLQAMAQAGAEPLEIMDERPSSMAMGASLLTRLRQRHADCTAVFFCNDDLALGALSQCHALGVRVPHDMAVAGFNDLPAAAFAVPTLTSVHTPRARVGERAAQRLLRLMDGEAPLAQPVHDLGFELRVRASA